MALRTGVDMTGSLNGPFSIFPRSRLASLPLQGTNGYAQGFSDGFAAGSAGSPPTITVVSPTTNTLPGSVGGFPMSYANASLTPIILTIMSADYICIEAVFLDGTAEIVFRAGAFQPGYRVRSILAGTTLKIIRDGGWPGQVTNGSNLAVGLTIDAIGSGSDLITVTDYWQMPPSIVLPSTVAQAVVAPAIVDHVAIALSRVCQEFRDRANG